MVSKVYHNILVSSSFLVQIERKIHYYHKSDYRRVNLVLWLYSIMLLMLEIQTWPDLTRRIMIL